MKRIRAKAPAADYRKTLIEIGEAIARLGASLLGARPAAPARPARVKAVRRRPARRRVAKKPMSPKQRRDLQLQGRYMAAVRSLSEPNKAKIRALRARKGVEAAIAAALRLAR